VGYFLTINMKHINHRHCLGGQIVPASLRRCGSHAGFTLVELLIVIAIIAALASVVFALSGTMKKSALKTREMNNIRNISTIILVYHTDLGRLPGPVNRGIRVPSGVPDTSRKYWLSTFLEDEGYPVGSDDLWKTSLTAAKGSEITYVLNNVAGSDPGNFFGRIQGGVLAPRTLLQLRANKKDVPSQDLSQIWMVATADDENYGSGAGITLPVDGRSAWGGRFYSYFDGRVEFVKRQTPSIYP
jgi:prepilin-type N-terminal cleavage/methylation domain-containing protein